MERTIWVVTETIFNEYGAPAMAMENNINYYSTREKAIKAIYDYLANDFEDDDLENNVKKTLEDAENPSGNLIITTYCGDKYGMFDCEYYIEEYTLDKEFGTSFLFRCLTSNFLSCNFIFYMI